MPGVADVVLVDVGEACHAHGRVRELALDGDGNALEGFLEQVQDAPGLFLQVVGDVWVEPVEVPVVDPDGPLVAGILLCELGDFRFVLRAEERLEVLNEGVILRAAVGGCHCGVEILQHGSPRVGEQTRATRATSSRQTYDYRDDMDTTSLDRSVRSCNDSFTQNGGRGGGFPLPCCNISTPAGPVLSLIATPPPVGGPRRHRPPAGTGPAREGRRRGGYSGRRCGIL